MQRNLGQQFLSKFDSSILHSTTVIQSVSEAKEKVEGPLQEL